MIITLAVKWNVKAAISDNDGMSKYPLLMEIAMLGVEVFATGSVSQGPVEIIEHLVWAHF